MKKRNTVQKGIVFDVFHEMNNHPSAGMVYEAVHEKYPEISKATVYRLLADAAGTLAVKWAKGYTCGPMCGKILFLTQMAVRVHSSRTLD